MGIIQCLKSRKNIQKRFMRLSEYLFYLCPVFELCIFNVHAYTHVGRYLSFCLTSVVFQVERARSGRYRVEERKKKLRNNIRLHAPNVYVCTNNVGQKITEQF